MEELKDCIHIKGARVHNLRNIEVRIPHNALVVITGLSGSGKSTLAFDTIFAEGQRRYVESLSAYARQFLGRINKPDVDLITGIAPAIAIEQKVNTRNPRSTVGTTTEIYDYLKLLFARVGHTFSPVSGREVRCYTTDDVAAFVLGHEGARAVIAAPLTLAPGQGLIEKLTLLLSDGLMRVYADGRVQLIEDLLPTLASDARPEDMLVVIDRLRVASDDDTQTRLRDSVSRAFSYGDDRCSVLIDDERHDFSARFEADGIEFEPPTEHLFSFNNPIGACPRCEGYGKVVGIDEDLVIPDKSKTIYEDAIACWRGETMRRWKEELVRNADKFGFPIPPPHIEKGAGHGLYPAHQPDCGLPRGDRGRIPRNVRFPGARRAGLPAHLPLLGASRHPGGRSAGQGPALRGDAPRRRTRGAVCAASRQLLCPRRGNGGRGAFREHDARGHDVRLYGQLPPGEGALRPLADQPHLPCETRCDGRISRPDG